MPQTRPIERKLTTVLAADAANYSGRMSRDEEGTVRALRATRAVIDDAIVQCGGRIANTSGDGLIADIPSVVGAVRCAIDIQRTINSRPHLLAFRLGIHLGDVIIEGQDLLGDGVNLAARLQEMAEVGGILVSQHVYDMARNNLGTVELRPLGPATPKHFPEEIGVYAVIAEGVKAPRLLDNLGPKVTQADPPMAQDEPVATAPEPEDTPVRKKFKKDRNRILGALGAVVVVDITAGLPFLVTTIPEIGLLYLLYSKWRAYKDTSARTAPS